MKVASLHYDVIFKKAFSKPKIFAAFVKDFTGIELEIDKVETEKSFSPAVGKVNSHFDLFVEDKKNRVIVDIQHKRLPDHYDRFLHYHCTALLEQIDSALDYRTKMNVFTLVVLTSGDKHKTDLAITDFEPKNLQGEGIGETQHKIIYICPKYMNENTPKIYQKWMKAIEDSLDGEVEENQYDDDVIQEIFKTIEIDRTTPDEYARMKDEYANELHDKMKNEEARQKGLKEGVEKATEQLAKGLLNILDVETIALTTGLSIAEVEKLKN